ncbi:hypothetical protein LguiA_008725 [Lonicera macranthoides]
MIMIITITKTLDHAHHLQLISPIQNITLQFLKRLQILSQFLNPQILHTTFIPPKPSPPSLLFDLLIVLLRIEFVDGYFGSGEVAVEDGVDGGVAEGEKTVGGRGDDDGDLSAGDETEIAGLLEEACSAL